MTSENELRKRNTAQVVDGRSTSDKDSARTGSDSNKPSAFSIIDALRAVFAVVLISALGSYLTTRGESWIWGFQRPWWTEPKLIRAAIVGYFQSFDPLQMSTDTASATAIADPADE